MIDDFRLCSNLMLAGESFKVARSLDSRTFLTQPNDKESLIPKRKAPILLMKVILKEVVNKLFTIKFLVYRINRK